MREYVVFGSVVMSPILFQLTAALLLTVLISFLLLRLNFYRLVWHRPLVELAMFLILLGLAVSLTPDALPLVAPNASARIQGQ